MCGIPVHAVDTYVERLIKKGQMVAVCEQVEVSQTARRKIAENKGLSFTETLSSPSSTSHMVTTGGAGTGVIKRAITRLITPGTLIDDHLLHPRHHNYLATIFSPRLLLPQSFPSSQQQKQDQGQQKQQQSSLSQAPWFALSWMDLSTGEFNYSSSASIETLRADIDRLSPSEIVVPDIWTDPFVLSSAFPFSSLFLFHDTDDDDDRREQKV